MRVICQQRTLLMAAHALVPDLPIPLSALLAQHMLVACRANERSVGAGVLSAEDTFEPVPPSPATVTTVEAGLPFDLVASLKGVHLPALARLELWAQVLQDLLLPPQLQLTPAVTHAQPLSVLPRGHEQLAAELCAAVGDSGLQLPVEPLQLLMRIELFLVSVHLELQGLSGLLGLLP